MVMTRFKNLAGAAIAALFLFGCDLAPAQTLLSGFVTAHRDRCGADYGCMNANNTGLGLRLDDGPLAGWSAGIYRNSDWRTSVYVARERRAPVLPRLDVGFVAGLATGYARPLVPVLTPEIVLSVGRMEAAAIAQPFGPHRSLSLQLRWKL